MKKNGGGGDDDNESPWMRDCIEEVMKLTLQSHSHLINLSPQFCSNLLKHDPIHSSSSHSQRIISDSSKGVPLYPLYKHLASSLFRFMDSSAMTVQDTLMHHKHNQWHKLVLDKGSQLLNILRNVSFEFHVQEPFFSQLKDGLKTIEGRCATSKYSRIELGDLILINKSVVFEVQGIRRYPTFSDMLEAEKLEKVLPGVESVEEGLEVYRRFYTEEKELANGVLAIIVSKVAFQPYIPLADLFSGLSYEGVQGLLGLMHTTGTSPDALPPSKSTLLASFNMPCNPNVKSSSLTHGARALAKHAGRSSDGYWGSLDGSDSNKNRLAMNVINYLIGHCCWMNLHAVSPHGVVFEIRVADGYGARWTEDGSKFIGFLEPYMRNGHSKGWKH